MFKNVLLILIIISLAFVLYLKLTNNLTIQSPSPDTQVTIPAKSSPKSTLITLKSLPAQKILNNDYHIFQTFNNCGPASLSMALSYYGINTTQSELGQKLRPFQVANGNNDDKSVTLDELAKQAQTYDLLTFHRPNGNINLIKQFINYDMPIIARTLLHQNDDIGHYRIIKGYDDNSSEIIQDDSFEGKNLRFSYQDFNQLWSKFNFEYLVLIPKNKIGIAEQILGQDLDQITSWKMAVKLSQSKLAQTPDDIYARFNLSVAYYNIGEYQKSVAEFEKIENKLPFRTLWYQIEPIESYYELGNYDRVFQLTDKILNNQNRAFSELYILRGKIYQKQGKLDLAKTEFGKAIFYNENLQIAKDALNSL